MYQARRPFRSETLAIRKLPYHVLLWGEPAPHKTPLVLVHGWMDVAASYQFMVDALSADHFIIAPDWRGFGKTPSNGADSFWFPDYLADLDFLLDHFSPGAPVNLVGHSMGGNVAMLYAGVRPERVRRLINLEGFGMPATVPAQAASRYVRWMDELKQLHRGALDMRPYDSLEGVARRLIKTNPRLPQDKAEWLAGHWATRNAQGQWVIQGDPAHKISSAHLYRADEVHTIHQRISMPALAVIASDDSLSQWWNGSYTLAEFHERMRAIPHLKTERIDNSGHMLHHDQPEALARLIEDFIA
jgi:pimeloyl-ACP methyl ester carboxylesterase